MNKKSIHLLTQAAMIAALYVVLTFIANRLRPRKLCGSGPFLGSSYHSSPVHSRRHPGAVRRLSDQQHPHGLRSS